MLNKLKSLSSFTLKTDSKIYKYVGVNVLSQFVTKATFSNSYHIL